MPESSKPQAPDKAHRKIRHSSFFRHVFGLPASQEWDSCKFFLRREWHWVVVALIGLMALLMWVRPLPPARVTLAVGPENSALARLGERYVAPFAQAGVKLNLVYTDHAGLASAIAAQQASAQGGQVQAAFLIAGMQASHRLPDLVSLGSVEYAPMWVFYRGQVEPGADFFQAFANGRFRIGLAGPVSRALIEQMAALRGFTISAQTGFESVADRQMVQRFIAGQIDVIVIVDGYDSHYVQQLAAVSDARLFDMGLAAAFERLLPFLERVVVPRGSLDMVNIQPVTDVTILASTVSLLVDKELHPAVQQLFLTATAGLDELTEPFFAQRGAFPAYLDPQIPLSPVARRFYAEGGLALSQRLPYWLASLIDRLWLLVLGLIAVIYPLSRLIPSYRVIRSQLQISDAYEVIHHIDVTSADEADANQLQGYVDDLDELERHLRQCWMSSESMDAFYHLRTALNQLRARLRDRLSI